MGERADAALTDAILAHWSSGDANFTKVETRFSIVVEMWLSIAIETQPLLAVETRLLSSLRRGSVLETRRSRSKRVLIARGVILT